jgi:hypothetical protein
MITSVYVCLLLAAYPRTVRWCDISPSSLICRRVANCVHPIDSPVVGDILLRLWRWWCWGLVLVCVLLAMLVLLFAVVDPVWSGNCSFFSSGVFPLLLSTRL